MTVDFGDGYRLRRATDDDHPALLDICLKTGDAGEDATASQDDPTLLGNLYAVPYQVLEPDFAFVLDGPEGVVGYVLGAPDSNEFYARMESEWLEPMRQDVRDPGPDESQWRGSDAFRRTVHHPGYAFPEALAPYPSHGHIDLLPQAQGKGLGTRMLRHLMQELAAAGSPGIHLGVLPSNGRALTFYEKRLGFEPLAAPGLPSHCIYMVRSLP
ncbi:GNAT family N-acetyltransferase [Consotaella aegiceratis]|uniref:GNAT family N-acetyltransferase n=1 Tax=Consotaella aegiceratis TaxID=3097961 RepID=UPI002F411B39